MNEKIEALRARCIDLIYNSIVVEGKVPSLQGVCEILSVIHDGTIVDTTEIKSLLSTLVEQGEKANNLALVKSNIADTL